MEVEHAGEEILADPQQVPVLHREVLQTVEDRLLGEGAMSHLEGRVVVTRRNGGTTRHRKGPQNLPNLTTTKQKRPRRCGHTRAVSTCTVVLACRACFTGARETLGVCARLSVVAAVVWVSSANLQFFPFCSVPSWLGASSAVPEPSVLTPPVSFA